MIMERVNIAVFASGSGSNCENLIQYFSEKPCARVALVISNKSDAYVLERAKRLGVPSVVVPKTELQKPEVVMALMEQYQIGFVVLAGFLPLIPNYLIDAFPSKMVNIHPSLLPKYGGKGMWGHHVHEAVKAAGETETGMTVHWVTPQCDAGDIIIQYRVALSPTDTADDIAAKEHLLEMEHFPKVIEELILTPQQGQS
jgi:phosphoribosylglycinamide formyltransferase-1